MTSRIVTKSRVHAEMVCLWCRQLYCIDLSDYFNVGVAVALKQAQSPAFHSYIASVLDNAQMLGEALMKYGYTLVTGDVDTTMIKL